jgi:hypothetical protein
MLGKNNFTSIQNNLSSLAWDWKLLLFTTSAVAIGSVIRLAYRVGFNEGVYQSIDLSHQTCCIYFIDSFLIPISIGLLAAALALFSRRLGGLLVALVALIWTTVTYGFWHRGTLGILKLAELKNFSDLPNQSQTLLPLNNATWWDLLVLATVVAEIVWLSKIVIETFHYSRKRFL